MNGKTDILLPNAPTGIVACSASDARCWKSERRFGEWTLTRTMHHEASTDREAELTSDRPGRSFDSRGSGRHAMSPSQSAHEHEAQRFAQEVAGFLNQSVAAGEFKHLILFAAPHFLGLLRDKLSDKSTGAVIHAAAKNLTRLDVEEIKAYLA